MSKFFTMEFFNDRFTDKELDDLSFEKQMEKVADLANEKLASLPKFRKNYLEALITGHMEALKPLLEEWARLK